MKYLLDTNICITFLRGTNPSVLEAFKKHTPSELAICATVRSELVFGALRSSDPDTQLQIVHRFLAAFPFLPMDEDVADGAARIRADLAAAGNIIGPYDLQIAATAVKYRLSLVTHNIAEFSRVKPLVIEDWEA